MVGRVGPRTRWSCARCTGSPTSRCRCAARLHWDVAGALPASILDGLRGARGDGRLGIGIDSWAVDYGLLDADGALLGNPVHYRDARTDGGDRRGAGATGADRLYADHRPAAPAVQHRLPAGRGPRAPPSWPRPGRLLLIPDLLGVLADRRRGAEVTNASTTGLLDVRTRQWSDGPDGRLRPAAPAVARRCGRRATRSARCCPVAEQTGLGAGAGHRGRVARHRLGRGRRCRPTGDRFAYISCGTWSLVGVELDAPVLTEASRAANFTNEPGVDGTIRYLRNVMGLWLLQESLRAWAAPDAGSTRPPAGEAAAAAGRSPRSSTRTTRPSCRRATCPPGSPRPAGAPGQPPPADRRPPTVRCILDSLALAHRAGAARRRAAVRPRRSTWCTWSAAARATPCCASSPPTPAACRWWPARSRRPPRQRAGAGPRPRRRAGGLADLRGLLHRHLVPERYAPQGNGAAWDALDARTPRS